MSPKQIFVWAIILFLVISCHIPTPDYVGSWLDSTTVPGTTITIVLKADTFTITIDIENPKPTEPYRRVVTGSLKSEGSTLTATIKGVTNDGVEVDEHLLQAILALIGGDTHTATYSIEEDTMTLSGDLLERLTGQDYLTLIRL